jgi:hypothetical protein
MSSWNDNAEFYEARGVNPCELTLVTQVVEGFAYSVGANLLVEVVQHLIVSLQLLLSAGHHRMVTADQTLGDTCDWMGDKNNERAGTREKPFKQQHACTKRIVEFEVDFCSVIQCVGYV